MSTNNKESIYTCPHCREKTFTPLTKAFAGQLNSYGKPGQKCGKLCVNGKAATIFNAVFSLVCFILCVAAYIAGFSFATPLIALLIVLMLTVPKLVNAFFFRLEKSIKRTM